MVAYTFLTRFQAIVAIVRALELEKTSNENIEFIDLSNNYWAKEEIKIGVQHGNI